LVDINALITGCTFNKWGNGRTGGSSPPHGIYWSGNDANGVAGVTVTNCVFSNGTNTLAGGTYALHWNSGICGECDIVNNIITNCAATFAFNSGYSNVISGNLAVDVGEFARIYRTNLSYFYNNTVDITGATVIPDNASIEHFVFVNNLFNTGTTKSVGKWTNNVFTGTAASLDGVNGNVDNASISFIDASGGNFRLSASDSAAIDAGVNLSAYLTTDLDGNTYGADGNWDVGAYEYQSGGAGGGTDIKRRGRVPGFGRGRGGWR